MKRLRKNENKKLPNIQKIKTNISNTISKLIILPNIPKTNKQRNRNSRIHIKKINEKQRTTKITKFRKKFSILHNITKIKRTSNGKNTKRKNNKTI